jgi:predicted nucleotide-binding protein (sugar kinase/HSP70/actin superfamily)
MTGKILAHLETRPAGEVTVFHLLDQEGPCQNGNWHDALPMILDRLGEPDAVAVWPNMKNNYLGGGDKVALLMVASCIAGDLMNEVRSSLRCLALEPENALQQFNRCEDNLLESAKHGILATERQLSVIAGLLAQIPIRISPRKVPKVLLFGGINRIFVDKPVIDFFEKHGILTKTNDVSEFLSFLEFEWMKRSGFAHRHIRPEQHYSISRIMADLFNPPLNIDTRRALRARIHCRIIELLEKRWRHIMADSGLLFTPHIPFHKLTSESHDMISWNGWTEAPCTLGRYLSGIKGSSFDGYINVGAFNCTPANTATAVINLQSKHNMVPYTVIEADGTSISPSQIRQLETIAAQILQRHKQRHRIPETMLT